MKPKFWPVKTKPRKGSRLGLGQPKTNKSPPSAEDYTRADRLRDLIAAAKRSGSRFSRETWANEMKLLRKSINDERRIEEVMAWLAANKERMGSSLQGHKVPVVLNAKEFRRVFNWLEEIAKQAPTIAETELGTRLFGQIKSMKWPKIKTDDLRRAVEISLANYHKFRARATKVRDAAHAAYEKCRGANRIPSDVAGWALFTDVVISRLSTPENFVRRWFRMINLRVKDWDDWSGHLSYITFGCNDQAFEAWTWSWFKGWRGYWEQFLKEMA